MGVGKGVSLFMQGKGFWGDVLFLGGSGGVFGRRNIKGDYKPPAEAIIQVLQYVVLPRQYGSTSNISDRLQKTATGTRSWVHSTIAGFNVVRTLPQ